MGNGKYTDDGFRLLRNEHVMNYLVKPAVKGFCSFCRVRVENGENLPGEGPALLLPKHRSFLDPPVHGLALYEETGRYANYIMRTFRFGNHVLEKIGGVQLRVKRDAKRIKDPERREMMLNLADKHNRHAWEYIRWLYDNDELVLSYPEGGVVHEDMGNIRTGSVRYTLEIQRETGKSIPVIPIGTEYMGFMESPRKKDGRRWFYVPKFPVVVRIGEPKITEPGILEDGKAFENFVRELGGEIGYLSGLG